MAIILFELSLSVNVKQRQPDIKNQYRELIRRQYLAPLFPSSNLRAMRRVTDAALEEALQILHPPPAVVLRLEIRLGGLVSAPVQETLFEEENARNSRRQQLGLRHLQTSVPDGVILAHRFGSSVDNLASNGFVLSATWNWPQ